MPNTVEVWAFRCPECGFGHHEFGGLTGDHELFCMVCDHDTGRVVRLERWLIEENSQEPIAGTRR